MVRIVSVRWYLSSSSHSYGSTDRFYQKVREQLTEWQLVQEGWGKLTQVLTAKGNGKQDGTLSTQEVHYGSRFLKAGEPA